MAEPQLVVVKWLDAWADTEGFNTLHGISTSHSPMDIETLGWLLHRDDTGISIANEKSSQDGHPIYRGRTFVPAGMIVSVSPFNMSKPRNPRKAPEAQGDSNASNPIRHPRNPAFNPSN